jgi:RimJ/RimL family protein N-acetyltransferase
VLSQIRHALRKIQSLLQSLGRSRLRLVAPEAICRYSLETWAWPEGHARHGRLHPDVCEIGYTWLTRDAIRTAANTEAKLLMLTHAFEVWQVLRVCLHTDARNLRSQAAIERIGGKFEGVLRAHRMAADFVSRDSYRYSIVAAGWPEAKRKLVQLLNRS